MISERFDTGFAPAKINLTLHITGQRSDGYHLLDSLVAFATVGDQLHAQPAPEFGLSVTGPGALGVPEDNSNLILRAARLCDGPPQRFHLEKNLPTASGIGGGSSDAAAAVRLMNAPFDRAQMLALGADIPMCLTPVTAHVQGIGENITAVPDLPDMHAVLVNPRISVSTPAIFKALTTKDNSPMSIMPEGLDDFLPWLADQRNDLQKPAENLFPEITQALSEMQNTGPDLTRMSGSGATCFALYNTENQAQAAAQDLLQAHPDWWVKSCILGSIKTQNARQNG